MKYLVKLCLPMALLAVSAAAYELELSESFEVETGQPIRVVIKAGEVSIQSSESGELKVGLSVECRRETTTCRDNLEKIRLATENESGTLMLDFVGIKKRRASNMEITAEVEVPGTSPLSVKMGAGDLSVVGSDRDISVDMYAGAVDIRVSETAVQRVRLDAGMGPRRARSGRERTRRPKTFSGR